MYGLFFFSSFYLTLKSDAKLSVNYVHPIVLVYNEFVFAHWLCIEHVQRGDLPRALN